LTTVDNFVSATSTHPEHLHISCYCNCSWSQSCWTVV